MACSEDYIQDICKQISPFGLITNRKMFGEYMIYINDKPIILVCDNIPHIKKQAEYEEYMLDADTNPPYNGAKEHYVLDMENEELLAKVIPILEKITPIPKPKKKK